MISNPGRACYARLVAVLVVFGLIIAACGNGDGDGAAAPDNGDVTTTTAAPAGEPQRGGTLVYGLEADTQLGWTPATTQCAISCHLVMRTFTDPLTTLNEDGETVPYLLESFEPSDDYMTWTLKLREGIEFHNGEPLDAEAMAMNLQAHQDPGAITFAAFVNAGEIEVVDDLTVDVHMQFTPWVSFPSYLAGQLGYMVAPAQLADAQDGPRNPIGTGPFVFERWRVNDSITFTRNDNYWREGLPYLDRVELRPLDDIQSRQAALEDGVFSITHASQTEFLANIRARGDQLTIYEADQFGEVGYFMINSAVPPLDDVRVRRALAHATDGDEILELRGRGIGQVANGPMPPGSPGYLDDTGYPEYDPDMARQLIAEYEAEHGPLPTIQLGTTVDPFNLGTTELVQAQWQQAGIRANLVQIEQGQYITEALLGNFQVFAWRNAHGLPDPDTNFVWWHSALAPDVGELAINFGRIRDDVIDAALLQIRTNPNEEARLAAAEEINRRMGEQVYNLWSSWTIWTIATQNNVRGVADSTTPDGDNVIDFVAGQHFIAQIWIDQ